MLLDANAGQDIGLQSKNEGSTKAQADFLFWTCITSMELLPFYFFLVVLSASFLDEAISASSFGKHD